MELLKDPVIVVIGGELVARGPSAREHQPAARTTAAPAQGSHGARRRPGVSPGSGLTETATGPGSTLTARGGADSLWLQRFAFLKLQPLDTVGSKRRVFRDFCTLCVP